jgi:acyl transferase domain-containing protein/thioesterase domain-containing protein
MTNTEYQPGPNDVAIVGLALRVPGADSVYSYWRNLRDGVESVERYSDEELAAAGVSAELLANPNYVRAGAALRNLEMFDAEFFGLSPKEAAIMDPQHRHFLECAWEALESAGHPPATFDGRIGVFAGCGMNAYFAFNLLTNPELVQSVGMFLLRHTGNDKDFLATRVSYCFDLKGPSVNVQTACSTSLVAVHTACQSLLGGECDLALAGGVTIELPHGRGYLYKKNDILSPDGHCRAFDHRSQGTVFGSGAGVAALRRLDDALRDGDHIFAVIKGSAVNNDGASKVGYFAPSVDGQAAAAAEALAVADITADTIGYLECHGTGTPIGDPIEIAAMTQAHRQTTDREGYCAIGSVKTNIGHLDTAAGVAGLAKAALSLEHKLLPPSLNYEAPNPSIDFAGGPFVVNDRLHDWKRGDTPRRAAVNSLGVGGTNAHVVLEEAPPRGESSPTARDYQLFALSARNRGALDDATRRLAQHLHEHPEQSSADVAFTLLNGRHAFDMRRIVVAGDPTEAAALLEANDPNRVFTHKIESAKPSVVFLLPGGGAQYPRMGRDLYEAEPIFRQWIDRGLALLQGKLDVDLRMLWFTSEGCDAANDASWQRPSIQLPAIYLCEYALAQLWLSWGVQPAAFVGHSMGENTAAALAGVLSFEDGLALVALRGKLFERVAPGGMLSVPLAAEAVTPLLGDRLDLATVNAPDMCTVSGPNDALDELFAKLAERGVDAKRIPIHIAAHSRMLEPILADFEKFLRTLTFHQPKVPFTSNLTGEWITEAQATDPRYWVNHLRGTVRFGDCIGTIMQTPGRVLLEVGPGKTLTSLARQHRSVPTTQVLVSSLRHPKEAISDVAFFLTTFGRLWTAGVDVDVKQPWAGEQRRRVQLPTYAFQHQRYWIEPGKAVGAAPVTTSLARIADRNDWFFQPVWKRRELDAPATLPRSTWLVFVDETGLGERLLAKLRDAGHDVVAVRTGDAFHRKSATEYVLSPEHGEDGYRALVRELAAGGKLPSRIVHLWPTTDAETFRPGSSFFHRNLEQGFYSLLFLGQALADETLPGPLHVSVVSTGMQQVADERLRYPEKATILGPCGVLPRELPATTCLAIDVTLPAAPSWKFGSRKRREAEFAALVERVFDEVTQAPRNSTVALRGERRYEQVFEKAPAPSAPQPGRDSNVRIRPRGTYLITGGLGGIGLTIAEHLAQTAKARLVLVGRTAFPPPTEWDGWLRSHAEENPVSAKIRLLRELEAIGAEVLTLEADVTDVEAMRGVVETATARFGGIHGVVHAAGLMRDNLISLKTQGEVEEVFSPKIHGTLVLDELLRDVPLDFFVVFSSTSTAITPAGQVDYVAANAYLNAFAQSRHRADRPVIALNWGIWNEVGMAAQALGHVAAPATTELPVVHPLFDYRIGGVHDRTVTLVGRHSTLAHWVYDEHRTASGQAILPGTGYIELVRAALTELGETAPFELRDLFFLRPLAIDDERPRDVLVRLTRDEQGYAFEVQSKQTTDDGRLGRRTHAQGRVVLGATPRPQPFDLAAIRRRCTRDRQTCATGALRTKQEDHVSFGPRWRVLHEAAYGDGEATARLELHEEFADDLEHYALHPALLDIATGFAMNLIRGYERCDDLWVPVSYKNLTFHGPLTRSLVSWIKNRGDNHVDGEFAVFDVVIADPAGRVLVEVEGFSIKRLPKTDAFGGDAATTAIDDLQFEHTGPGGDDGETVSPAEAAFRVNLRNGIRPVEGAAAFEAVVRSATSSRVIVSSLDVNGLIQQADAQRPAPKAAAGMKFERPKLDGEFIEPRDNVERMLAALFEELLGVEGVGASDSFFDLGGHSLIAVRLFAQIKKTYHCEFPISVLFSAPTVEAIGRLIKAEIGVAAAGEEDAESGSAGDGENHKTRYIHLVPMHEGNGGTERPLFVVAGMFGNVLNLRHLAHLVGSDRPCYGLQARGLYGEHEPHATFEEMATDYLRELRSVQPHGPYLLSGFSGGGLTAYEMAVQLRREGEEVAFLGLLDTPLVRSEELTKLDKVKMHLQRISREKHRYFWNFVSGRLAWEWKQLKRRLFAVDEPPPAAKFHSETIEKAFRAACEVYQTPRYDDKVVLFRPKLAPIHIFGPDRMINVDRRFIYHDNGWSRYVPEVEIHEVPGDHDSMVLEPNVRTMGARLRKAIKAAEAAYAARNRERGAEVAGEFDAIAEEVAV